jgi:hypothetical protein
MKDLFENITPVEKQHPNFRNINTESEYFIKKILNEWFKGFIDRDNKIINEFQTTFNSTFWEIYLFACFKELNWKLDLSKNSPDFIISTGKYELIVEATIANNANNELEEFNKDIEKYDHSKLSEMLDSATLRIANSLSSKYTKFKKKYKDLSHVKNKPFILALAPFDQPFFFVQNVQAIQRVLYAYEGPVYENIEEKNERIILGHKYKDSIYKENGAEIILGFFSKEYMNEISAVLFSNTATLSKARALSNDTRDIYFHHVRFNKNGLHPHYNYDHKKVYKETLLDGLTLFHNPFANIPIESDLFPPNLISNYYYSIENKFAGSETPDNHLIARVSIGFNQI